MLEEEANNSLTVTQLNGRSIPTTILQTVVRPFRPRLVKPGKPTPPGSQPLQPPKSASSKCDIKEYQVKNNYLNSFTPKSPEHTSKIINPTRKHQLLYFAGGGFQSPPSSDHWKFITELSLKLPQYEVTVVSSPLAPNSPAKDSLPAVQEMLTEILGQAVKEGRAVSMAGDSSGANIALSLAITSTSSSLGDPASKAEVLKNVLVISPPTDMRNINPAIAEAERHDPVLTKRYTDSVADTWVPDVPREGRIQPELSPLLADLDGLKRAGIKIHGCVGTYDVLSPDGIAFRKKCQDAGIQGEWLEWEGQMHCFPLAWHYGLPESKKAKDWIIDVLNRNV